MSKAAFPLHVTAWLKMTQRALDTSYFCFVFHCSWYPVSARDILRWSSLHCSALANLAWNLDRADTTKITSCQVQSTTFDNGKPKVDLSRTKPYRAVETRHMRCHGDWQLLIGLIQPLGACSSLADLDTAVLLSNSWHCDPWEPVRERERRGGEMREKDAYLLFLLE